MANYTDILRDQFELRRAKNRRYSLRAYSRFLGLDPGSLSSILRGKRALSAVRAEQILGRLQIDGAEREDFLNSLWSQHFLPTVKSGKRTQSKALDSHLYETIVSEWEYASALCLLDLKTFKPSTRSLQNALGVSRQRAATIWLTLEAAGLIRPTGNGYLKAAPSFHTTEDVRSRALVRSHQSDLRRATRRLKDLDVLERDFSSITIAGSTKQLAEMKAMIREFRRQFEARFENVNGDAVFHLGLQLFPTTRRLKREES